MDSNKVMELLTTLKVADRIDPKDRENSILKLLKSKFNEYMDRDDEEMQLILDEAVQYQEKVVEELKAAVFIASDETLKSNVSENEYETEVATLKKKRKSEKLQTSQTGKIEELWFVSFVQSEEVSTLFSDVKESLEKGNTEKAIKQLDIILDKEPNNAGAYLAMYMAKQHIKTLEEFFANKDLSFDGNNYLKRVMQYASPKQQTFATQKVQERFAEKNYGEALILKLSMSTSEECRNAAELFEMIGDFKDAKVMAAECRAKEAAFAKTEQEAKTRLKEIQREKNQKQEIDNIHAKVFQNGNLSEDKLKGYIKRLEDLKGKYSDYDDKIKEAITQAHKRIADNKKMSVIAKADAIAKNLNGVLCAIVLILMLYFAMSFRFITSGLRFSLPAETQSAINSFLSAGVVYPWRSSSAYVADSIVDYALILHEVDDLYIKNSDITKIYTLQEIIPRIDYRGTSLKQLEVSKGCEDFSLSDAPNLERISLENLVYDRNESSNIKLKDSEKIKLLEVEGDCKNIVLYIENCPSLETVVLPAETTMIEIKGDILPQVQCENLDLVINFIDTGVEGN